MSTGIHICQDIRAHHYYLNTSSITRLNSGKNVSGYVQSSLPTLNSPEAGRRFYIRLEAASRPSAVARQPASSWLARKPATPSLRLYGSSCLILLPLPGFFATIHFRSSFLGRGHRSAHRPRVSLWPGSLFPSGYSFSACGSLASTSGPPHSSRRSLYGSWFRFRLPVSLLLSLDPFLPPPCAPFFPPSFPLVPLGGAWSFRSAGHGCLPFAAQDDQKLGGRWRVGAAPAVLRLQRHARLAGLHGGEERKSRGRGRGRPAPSGSFVSEGCPGSPRTGFYSHLCQRVFETGTPSLTARIFCFSRCSYQFTYRFGA